MHVFCGGHPNYKLHSWWGENWAAMGSVYARGSVLSEASNSPKPNAYRLKMHSLAFLLRATSRMTTERIWPASAITLVFAAFGWAVRGVTLSGALAGASICFVLFLSTGWGGFAGLCAVFLLTWLATRVGYRRKQALGTAEAANGRNAAQVIANLGTAAVCAASFAWTGNARRLLPAFAAALTEAAADTVSSEIGQALGVKARLVTNWRIVPSGTNGAITLPGTLAGMLAATLVACVLAACGVIGFDAVLLSSTAGFIGSLADSVLGATLERHGVLGNNAVNLVATIFAAVIAFTIAA